MKRKFIFLNLLVVGMLALTALMALASPPGSPPAQQATPTQRVVPTVPPPTRVPTRMPAGDLARVRAAGTLVVGTSLDNPPFSGYSEDFAPTGFDVALMESIANELRLKVEFKDFAFEGLLDALRLGQVDAAIAAISLTPQRLAVVDFTNPYFVGQDGLLAAADSNLAIKAPRDLAKLRVGVQLGTVYETFLQETLVDPALMSPQNLMTYLRPDQIVRDLVEGNLDVAMLDLRPAQTLARQNPVKLVGQGLLPQVFAIAVRKGSSLLPELNRGLTALRGDGTTAGLEKLYLDLESAGQPPATPPPSPTPIPTPAFTPTPVPCIDGMKYVADLNLDDRNMRAPPALTKGQKFTKTWRIRNSGTCNWSADFALTYVRGNVAAARMGGQDLRIGKIVEPGQTIDVSVPLVAPQAPGVYQGFWQMKNTSGTRFGETIWVGIRIPAPPTPTPIPATPSPGISFGVDRTTINQGECVTFRWDVRDVKAVYFFQQGQPFSQNGVAGQASRQVCPTGTTIYTLRVNMRNDEVREQHIQINVNPLANAPQIAQFSSSPEFDAVVGQCVNFWWEVRGDVSRVALVRNGTPLWDYAPVSGSRQDCPNMAGQIAYELHAWGSGGMVKAQRLINMRQGVPPPPPPPPPAAAPELRRLSGTEVTQTGSCIWVSWEFGANVAYARLLKNGQLYGDNAQGTSDIAAFSGNPNGDCDTPSPGVITYRLDAFNSTGQVVSREVRTRVDPR